MQINKAKNGTNFGNDPALPTVAIITTGGTIAQKPDAITGICTPFLSGSELIANNPLLLKVANIKLIEFSNIDSSHMTPDMWLKLSKLVNKILQNSEIHGVVITHGTDTMPEGAYFLDLTVKSNKPVVFTGTMRNAFALSFDGPANLYNAVIQASSENACDWGITLNLNQYIHSARDVAKTHTTNMQTFSSGVRGCLGYIERNNVLRFHDRLHRLYVPLPKTLPKVPLIKIYAGDDGQLVRAITKFGAKGVVIEVLGAGNVNVNVYKAIKYLISKNIVVVITSLVPEGGICPIYGSKGGGATLQKLKTILAKDLSGNKARILLMLLLPYLGRNHKQLCKYFSEC